MDFTIAVGESDFEEFRTSGGYYVDKTAILYELLGHARHKVTLFTRPRRFGKTLMASMFENFFNIAKDSRALFDGLEITKRKKFCDAWMNQYPVIFLSFKDVEGETFEITYERLKAQIAKLCRRLAPVVEDALTDDDKQTFLRLKTGAARPIEIDYSLDFLMGALRAVYGKRVILLLDEYDVPLNKAHEKNSPENDFYNKMLDAIRRILSAALKDNDNLKIAVVTGCFRIARESVFTGLNNFMSYSALDKKFSEYFGFSEEEVKALLTAVGRADKFDVVKDWYDGYLFGTDFIYNPWSVVCYVADLRDDKDAIPKAYWANTSSNAILRAFDRKTEFDVKYKFERLLNGGVVEQKISDLMTYDSLFDSEDHFWSALLMTGYVTKAEPDTSGDTIKLKIPNKEVASIFQETVVKLFRDTLDVGKQRALMDAFWRGDEEKVSETLSNFLLDSISYNDYHENYYHAFMTGLFVGLGYSVDSNKESGLGRPDIVVKDRRRRRALIIEAKRSEKESDMERDARAALDQIDAMRYDEGLDGYERVFRYGVAFYKKQAKALASTLGRLEIDKERK